MTQQEDKLYSKQLSFSFNTDKNRLKTRSDQSAGNVQHFMNREALNIRREAIERLQRDGIFPLHGRSK